MGYSGARGGLGAILAAEDLTRRARVAGPAPWASTEQIIARFRLAVDRVMGEAGLYHEATAADALRQAEGDPVEAAHLVRAHRSMLPRLATGEPVDPDEMTVLRRIVPAHRTPDGPQLLGRTTDYTGRLLERPAAPATAANGSAVVSRRVSLGDPPASNPPLVMPESRTRRVEDADSPGRERGLAAGEGGRRRAPRRFSAVLRELDLLVDHGPPADAEPFDVTRRAARPPAPRSAVLASMARAETGALVGLWYRSVLGPDGHLHEVTLGEVRHGRLPLRVRHPHTGAPVTVGRFRATETEAIEDLDGPDEDRTRFDVGYGLCLGHNERKAIAMANLDVACRRFGAELQQLLLLTVDGLDSGGFLEHLKLPHYVTFRSMTERKQALRDATRETT
ncbi:MAG: carbon-phosphorus lyase complex subunit PhnI [Pseudonocardia sp.]